ncbi:MAG: nucleoside triphosphate pyrophosphohydrolase [Armatimonadetes bacterium]|nr:nucleoside triphosphate pyrophosphohydrolase [Armatimonadota bacterium]
MQFTFEDLVAIMARLRGSRGCPWDREQTHASLAPYLLEEAHEALDAIARGDLDALRGELGDVLLQVVFHAEIAREAGGFGAGAVVDGLTRKLIDRHPHVFGDVRLGTASEVRAHWEELKRREAPDRDLFSDVPASLPALARAQKLLERTWPDGTGRPDRRQAADGIRRALDRVIAARAQAEAASGGAGERAALGDLLLAVVVLAETMGADAEAALRQACEAWVATRSSKK